MNQNQRRWQITTEQRQQVIERLLALSTSDQATPREQIAACKAVLAAEKQNQRDEIQGPAEEPKGPNQFIEIAKRLGIEHAIHHQAYERAGLPAVSQKEEPA